MILAHLMNTCMSSNYSSEKLRTRPRNRQKGCAFSRLGSWGLQRSYLLLGQLENLSAAEKRLRVLWERFFSLPMSILLMVADTWRSNMNSISLPNSRHRIWSAICLTLNSQSLCFSSTVSLLVFEVPMASKMHPLPGRRCSQNRFLAFQGQNWEFPLT